MRKQHRHRAVLSEDYGFTHCVSPERCDPSSHGAVTVVSVCKCGWLKEVNRNAGRIEAGAWHAPRPGDYVSVTKGGK